MVIQPVSKVQDGQKSEEFKILDVKWHVLAKKQTVEKVDYFNVYLYVNEEDIGDKSFKVTCSFQLISRGSEQPQSKQFKEIKFSKEDKKLNYGFTSFMKWDEFIDDKKKHVVHDIAFLEAEVIIEKL